MLDLKNISYKIRAHQILTGITTSFKPGAFSMIIGPNGSGKSTLLKIISGDIVPTEGTVHYGTVLCKADRLKEISKVRATLSQHSVLSFPMVVEEVVMMGRYPHFSFKPSVKDEEICSLALKKLNIEHLRDRNYLTLSGGERQRVHFAKTLAQIWEEQEECRYLLLDEPIASLDPNYQHEFLKIARELSQGLTVVAVMHDVNLASRYGDFFIALHEGELIAEGVHDKVMNTETLSALYEIPCVEINAEGSTPLFVFG